MAVIVYFKIVRTNEMFRFVVFANTIYADCKRKWLIPFQSDILYIKVDLKVYFLLVIITKYCSFAEK